MITCAACGFGHKTSEELRLCYAADRIRELEQALLRIAHVKTAISAEVSLKTCKHIAEHALCPMPTGKAAKS